MNAGAFRFRPPAGFGGPTLEAVVALAFAVPASAPAPASLGPALDLASRLGLLPRVAFRSASLADASRVESEAIERLARERARVLAHEIRLDETLAAIGAVAADLDVELAVLKGRALTLAGYSPAGARPSGDIDLLVSVTRLDGLRRELLRRCWVETPAAAPHHGAALFRPSGASVELHRYLPGVRLDDRRSADWQTLVAADRLEELPPGPWGVRLRVPSRDVLLAHALVHALAQHGLQSDYPGWVSIGDLLDLGAATTPEASAPWRRWIARDLSRREIDAALELARRAARGLPRIAGAPDDASRLADHFTACAIDPDYREALKSRMFEAPMSERPRWAARVGRLAGALVPPARPAPAGEPNGRARRAMDWVSRPFVLIGRTFRALRARRRLRAATSRSDLR